MESAANMDNVNTSTAPMGWTCSNCGAFVYFGQMHSCYSGGGNYQQVVTQQPPWWSIDMSLQRIATAFERLATAVEKLVESEE